MIKSKPTGLKCFIHNTETSLVSPKNEIDEPLEGERNTIVRNTIVFDGEKWVSLEEWEKLNND